MLTPSSSSAVAQRSVGIACLEVSDDEHAVLTAFNLGSCLGISAYDPVARVGGMVHCLLPLSKKDPSKAAQSPCMYVDTGTVELLRGVCALGGQLRRLRICVVGGAQMTGQTDVFEVGKNNYTSLRKILWKNQLLIAAESVGGCLAQTFTLEIRSGLTSVRSAGQWRRLE